MKKIQTEIIIAAPSTPVWEVLSSFLFYPMWNPFICNVEGKAAKGEKLGVTAKLRGFPRISFQATILTCEPPFRLGWKAIFLKGMFEAHHYFEIRQIDSGKSRFIHTEEFSGLLSIPALFLLEASFRSGYRVMNESLKKEAEKRGVTSLVSNC